MSRDATAPHGHADLRTTAGGVSWDPHGRNGVGAHATIQVPAALPAELAAAVPANARATLVSDGTAYAWLDPSGAVGWWSPGAAHPVLVRVPGGPWFGISAVAGPYVISGSILDTRTGAIATGTSLDVLHGGAEITGAAGGIAYGYTLPSGKDGPQIAVRVDTTRLPELHC